MKSKERLSDDYEQLKTRIFASAIVLLVGSAVTIWLAYRFVLFGNFANWMVSFFQSIFRVDYPNALELYRRIFRRNMDVFILIGITVIFFVVFRIYLNWVAKYFVEINRGIDALIKEDAGDVMLSAELSATERKINAIKRTLEKRKLDTERTEQQKNDLIVYLAHDLKTPLTTVIGYLTLLRDEPEISVELRAKYADIALDKAQRLESLINEFFDITRFSLTQITLDEETINLTRMLEQTGHELSPVLQEKKLTLAMELEPGVRITCDPDKLQRVFDNLFRNAMTYSYCDSSVLVSLTQKDGNAVVSITNHGKAIPADKLQRVFDQFFRLDSARLTATGGAGLGLAIAKGIVEQHGGRITAESRNEEITFTVTLPCGREKIV